MKSKKIVIITTAQPSTNPRMVKEYLALKTAGYNVKVLYCYAVSWAEEADKKLFEEYRIDRSDFILVGGHPQTDKLNYFISRVVKKLADKYFPNSLPPIFRTSHALYTTSRKFAADLYIAHNIGALPAVVFAAKKFKVKAGFDAEDFHRGEITMGKSLFDKNSKIEDRYFSQVDYFTAASPLILEKYHGLFPNLPGICINNVFPLRFLNRDKNDENDDDKLKLWWFSQKTGKGRGLEEIIQAMGKAKSSNITLTMFGIIAEEMKSDLVLLAQTTGLNDDQLIFNTPISEIDLFERGNDFDLGVALETGETDNRKYCLTNKIFTYLLCGNAIIFSDTPAQKAFWEENKDCGQLYERNDIQQLAAILKGYLDNHELLIKQKNEARKLAAEKYNWEIESQKLVDWVE